MPYTSASKEPTVVPAISAAAVNVSFVAFFAGIKNKKSVLTPSSISPLNKSAFKKAALKDTAESGKKRFTAYCSAIIGTKAANPEAAAHAAKLKRNDVILKIEKHKTAARGIKHKPSLIYSSTFLSYQKYCTGAIKGGIVKR